MDWLAAVDIYCERTGPGFWAEPVNALSNGATLIAAAWGAVSARQRGLTHPMLWLLIALAGCIGIGSFVFHTIATRWAELADTLPIWSFAAVFALAAMRWLGGMKPGWITGLATAATIAGAGLVLLFLANGEGNATRITADPLNGSGQYAPAVIALIVFAALMSQKRTPHWQWVWGATGVFLLALAFRTVDAPLCAAFPLGTHFMWHILNGVLVAWLLQILIQGISDVEHPTV